MKRKYNPRKFRMHRSYTAEEVAGRLSIHVGTVRKWPKIGLHPIDPGSKPYLYDGRDLIAYIKTKNASLKRPLQPDELFCCSCQKGTKSRPEDISTKLSGKKIGKNSSQVIITGKCEVCGGKTVRFGVVKVQEPAQLLDSSGNSAKVNIINS